MQQIERYGVIALVFLLVTIVAVSFWGDSKSPGFWSRLTGRGAKKDTVVQSTAPLSSPSSPATSAVAPEERAIQGELPLGPAPSPSSLYVPLDPPASSAPSSPAPESWAAASPAPAAQPPRPAPVAWSPPPQPPARPPARPEGTTEYVVRKGDSLIGIASRLLGSKNRWTEIRDLNQGVDPRRLSVGMKLAIPASGAGRAAAPAKSAVPARRPEAAPASPRSKPSSRDAGGTYVVRKGDTLQSIAERLLGSDDRWREIVAANPGVDPKRLAVGRKLRMPGRGSAEPMVAAASLPARSSDRPRVR